MLRDVVRDVVHDQEMSVKKYHASFTRANCDVASVSVRRNTYDITSTYMPYSRKLGRTDSTQVTLTLLVGRYITQFLPTRIRPVLWSLGSSKVRRGPQAAAVRGVDGSNAFSSLKCVNPTFGSVRGLHTVQNL